MTDAELRIIAFLMTSGGTRPADLPDRLIAVPPITHWSALEPTYEVIERSIVESISRDRVDRSPRGAALHPHKSRDCLSTPEERPSQLPGVGGSDPLPGS
jgi:hypothetical protein